MEPPGAWGETDAEGRFELTTFEPGDGAVPGNHSVLIAKDEIDPEDQDAEYPRWIPVLPLRYRSDGAPVYNVTVRKDEPNDFRFDLTD